MAQKPLSQKPLSQKSQPHKPVKVALFATCLVDMIRPCVGFATLEVLERAGCEVSVPQAQTCCGQPAYNTGDKEGTRRLAKNMIEAFADYPYVVAPSGSCAAMVKIHYPRLFPENTPAREAADDLAGRIYEITSFLVEVLGWEGEETGFGGRIAYHDACSGLREMGIKTQPRKLLRALDKVRLEEAENSEICCGFGGTFCVKYPDISDAMVAKKTKALTELGVDYVLAGEMGCLMNLAGKLRRLGASVEARHVIEVLSHNPLAPPIAGRASEQAEKKGP